MRKSEDDIPGPNWAFNVIVLVVGVMLSALATNFYLMQNGEKIYSITLQVKPERGDCGMVIDAERMKKEFADDRRGSVVVVGWPYEVVDNCVTYVTIQYTPIPKLTVPVNAPVTRQAMD